MMGRPLYRNQKLRMILNKTVKSLSHPGNQQTVATGQHALLILATLKPPKCEAQRLKMSREATLQPQLVL